MTAILLLIPALMMPALSHASACLIIDVPPQAVLSVYDGDTFTVFGVKPGGMIKYRVEGVNTPEISKKKGVPDEPGAIEAREFTRSWFQRGVFRLTDCGKATLDRIVGKVERNGVTLAQDLIEAGHQRKDGKVN